MSTDYRELRLGGRLLFRAPRGLQIDWVDPG